MNQQEEYKPVKWCALSAYTEIIILMKLIISSLKILKYDLFRQSYIEMLNLRRRKENDKFPHIPKNHYFCSSKSEICRKTKTN
jgi:hypothetical protein